MSESFTCPTCGAESHHPDDVRNGYCGRCHAFTGTVRTYDREGVPHDDVLRTKSGKVITEDDIARSAEEAAEGHQCTAESGTCATCQSGCLRRPGWFRPGEVERAADLLGVSLAELFRTRLVVDYWWQDDRLPTTFVLAPRMGDTEPGAVVGLDPHGRCTFYVEGRCQIHAAKPFECAQWYCGVDNESLVPHVEVARAWTDHQDQIAELLGEDPEVPPVTLGDAFDFVLGRLGLIAEDVDDG